MTTTPISQDFESFQAPFEKAAMHFLPVSKLSLPEGLYDLDESGNSIPLATPALVSQNDSAFIIIDGVKRISGSNKSNYPCIVLPSVDPLNLGLMRIELNKNRTLSLKEKILFAKWLSKNLNREEYLFWTQRIKVSDKERHELENLFYVDDDVLAAVTEGVLDSGCTEEFSSLKKDDRISVLDLFTKIPFSRQMQKEIIEWLPELSFRSNSTVKKVLESPELEDVVNHPKLNIPQKQQRIRDTLYIQRFPLYSSLQKKWKKNVAVANPDPSRVQFTPSPGFEKRKLEIKATVCNAAEAHKIFQKLASIPPQTWEELILPQ